MTVNVLFLIPLLAFVLLVGIVVALRLHAALNPLPPLPRAAGSPSRLLVVLGSGGHTAELLSALQSLPTSRYTHRTYVISSGDSFSIQKVDAYEKTLFSLAELRRKPYGSYDVAIVPRARRVHQSMITTPWSCFQCFWACVRVLASSPYGYQRQWQTYVSQKTKTSSGQTNREVLRLGITPFPDLIVTNGPATGLIVVLSALFLRFIGLGKPRASDGGGGMRALFVESWARVESLSLTGHILMAVGACQRVLVQWQGLRDRFESRTEYIGPLVK